MTTRFAKPLGARAARRAANRERRPGVLRPTRESNAALIHAQGIPAEMKALARVWLHFPDTRPSNILARSNALTRRRAKNKVARASRKGNR